MWDNNKRGIESEKQRPYERLAVSRRIISECILMDVLKVWTGCVRWRDVASIRCELVRQRKLNCDLFNDNLVRWDVR